MPIVCEGSFLCLDLCQHASELALVCVILLAFVVILERIIHVFHKMNPAVFNAIQGECALLGMISFLLFSIPALCARVGASVYHDLHEMIEFVHITLFLSTVAYLLVVAALASYKTKLEQHWRAACHQTRTQPQRIAVEDAFRAERGLFGLGWRRSLAPYLQLRCELLMRQQYFDLLGSQPLDYVLYLRLSSERVLGQLVHLGPCAWLALLASFGLTFLFFDGVAWAAGVEPRAGEQAFCAVEAAAFEARCNCTLCGGGELASTSALAASPAYCSGHCTWMCHQGEEYVASAVANTGLQTIGTVWIWTVMLVGSAFTWASTRGVLRALSAGSVATPPPEMVAPSPDALVAMAASGALNLNTPSESLLTSTIVRNYGALFLCKSPRMLIHVVQAQVRPHTRRPPSWLPCYHPRSLPEPSLPTGVLAALSRHYIAHCFGSTPQVLSLCAHAALCLMVYFQLPDNWPMLPLLLPPLFLGPLSLLRMLERLTFIFSVGTLAERDRVLAAMRSA